MTKMLAAITTMVSCLAAAPASRPATQPVLDTPQALQTAYRTALNAQDAKAALELFQVRTPGERATAEVLIANDLAAARLAASAEKAFGIPLLGGGTLLPPAEADTWKVDGDVAVVPQRKGARPLVAPLRRVDGSYKIDLLAWGMDWMDAPDGDAARARHAHARIGLDDARKRVDEGFYRTLDELRETIYNPDEFLSPRPGKKIEPKPPRPFRRPVKLDLSSPLATFRSSLLAKAEGDGAGWLRCQVIVDPADQPAFDAYARFITTGADLEEAAVRRFGADGAKKVAVFAYVPHPRSDALRHWPELLEAEDGFFITGDEARWEELEGVEFIRAAGEWKLRSRAKADVGQKPDEEGTDWTQILNLAADLQMRFAREVESGKFPSADAAKRAIDEAMKPPSTKEPI